MGDEYKNLFSTKAVYKIEKSLYEKGTEGFSLMMKAAFAAYEHINLNTVGKVIILCGKGNNGGDGYGLGALLFMAGRIVEIYKIEEPTIKFAFASAVAKKDIFPGDVINEKNCTFKRPGDGDFLARDYKKLFGKEAKKKIIIDQQIKKKYL